MPEVICSFDHVEGVANEHLFVYTGDSFVYSIRVLVKEGFEMEVKNKVESLVKQLGIQDYVVDVTLF